MELIWVLKRRKESDTYLTHVCRHCWSRESPVKSFQPTLWLSSAVDVISASLTHNWKNKQNGRQFYQDHSALKMMHIIPKNQLCFCIVKYSVTNKPHFLYWIPNYLWNQKMFVPLFYFLFFLLFGYYLWDQVTINSGTRLSLLYIFSFIYIFFIIHDLSKF